MGQFSAIAMTVGFFGAAMVALVRLGSRVRRRGGGGSAAFVGPFEDMWHPAAHRARLEVETVEQRVVPMPSPDGWKRRRDETGSPAAGDP